MRKLVLKETLAWWCKSSPFFLAVVWCAGLILGVKFASAPSAASVSLMGQAPLCPASIVGLMGAALLPFLLTAFAVFLKQPWMILLIAFCKAVSFGYSGILTIMAFGSSGWLVRLLLMFTDICTVPVLCWLWLRHIPGNLQITSADLALGAAAVIGFGSLDYCLISPYLAMLMA